MQKLTRWGNSMSCHKPATVLDAEDGKPDSAVSARLVASDDSSVERQPSMGPRAGLLVGNSQVER